jgi:peptidoglycan/xylan/chitin deacetylase (PgdA/CDA1 family)
MARVTLSLDNGPDPERTPRLLDVLARTGVAASFFVVGRQLERPGARAVAERAWREGHWIGNHSYSHRIPLGEDGAEAARREIDGAQELLGGLAHPSRWFRPFGGGGRLDRRLLSRAAAERLVAGRYSCVLWSCVPRDWEDAEAWPDVALAAIGAREEAGLDRTLVVIHDFVEGNDRHLARFVERCRAAGHELVQDFPPDCVPILRGELRGSIDAWVAD